MAKKIIEIFKNSALVVIGLLTLFILLLQLPPLQRELKNWIVEGVQTKTGWKLSCDELKLSWPLAFYGRDVQLLGKHGEKVYLKSFYCQPSWHEIWKDEFVFTSLYLTGLEISLPKERQDTVSHAQEKQRSASKSWLAALPKVKVSDLYLEGFKINTPQTAQWEQLFSHAIAQMALELSDDRVMLKGHMRMDKLSAEGMLELTSSCSINRGEVALRISDVSLLQAWLPKLPHLQPFALDLCFKEGDSSGRPFSVQLTADRYHCHTSGLWKNEGRTWDFHFSELTGRYASLPIVLQHKCHLHIDDEKIELTPFQGKLGEGEVAFELAHKDGGELAIAAEITNPGPGGALAHLSPYGVYVDGALTFLGNINIASGQVSGEAAFLGKVADIAASLQASLHGDLSECHLEPWQGRVLGADIDGAMTFDLIERTVKGSLGYTLPEGHKLFSALASKSALQGRVKIKGPWHAPELTWKLSMPKPWNVRLRGAGALVEGEVLGTLKASALIDDMPAECATYFNYDIANAILDLPNFQGAYGEGRATALLTLKHGPTPDFFFHIEGDKLPLVHLLKKDFDGLVSLHGTLQGSWKRPEGNLHLDFSDLAVNEGPLPASHIIFDLSHRQDHTLLEGYFSYPGMEPIAFSGDVPVSFSLFPWECKLREHDPLSLQARVSGALTALVDFIAKDLNATSGAMAAELTVQGTPAHPLVTGSLAVLDGSYENLETGTVLRNIALKARAVGSEILIDEFNGKDFRSGAFTGQGLLHADPAQGFPFTLKCHLDQMALINLDNAHSSFSGDLQLKGNIKGAKLTGNLKLVAPQITLPEELSQANDDDIEVIYVNVPEGKALAMASKQNMLLSSYPIELDVALSTGSLLHIGSHSLSSAWKGQLQVTGTLPAAQLHGDFNIQDGTFRYGGKTFELNQGVITFLGPMEKTSLYVIAKIDIDDITVEVIVRGPIKNPSIAFRSNPSLSQQEIISYLLFGKGPSEITPYQGNRLSQSISNLQMGSSAPNLLDKIRDSLAIDLGFSRSHARDGGKVSVQVGRQLSRRLYLSVNRNITDDINSVALEANVIKNLKFRGEINDDVEPQFFLKWKRDF